MNENKILSRFTNSTSDSIGSDNLTESRRTLRHRIASVSSAKLSNVTNFTSGPFSYSKDRFYTPIGSVYRKRSDLLPTELMSPTLNWSKWVDSLQDFFSTDNFLKSSLHARGYRRADLEPLEQLKRRLRKTSKRKYRKHEKFIYGSFRFLLSVFSFSRFSFFTWVTKPSKEGVNEKKRRMW